MSSHTLPQASGVPLRLKGWKVAIAIGAAVTLSPVIALLLFFVLAIALPVLPLFATLFAGFWLRGPHRRPTSAPERSPLLVTPRISSLPSSFRDA
jgi:hypothetical protein